MYLDFALTHRGMHELMFRHDLLESNELGLRDASLPIFSLLVDLVGRARPEADARLVAGALLANLYGIAQLWNWGSLQLATGADDFATPAALRAGRAPGGRAAMTATATEAGVDRAGRYPLRTAVSPS